MVVYLAVKTVMVHWSTMNDDAQMKIRLPRFLKDEIDAAAESSGRSLNAEIVWRLERSIGEAAEKPKGMAFVRRAKKASLAETPPEDRIANLERIVVGMMAELSSLKER